MCIRWDVNETLNHDLVPGIPVSCRQEDGRRISPCPTVDAMGVPQILIAFEGDVFGSPLGGGEIERHGVEHASALAVHHEDSARVGHLQRHRHETANGIHCDDMNRRL
ncbi:hypothetical protein GCM10027425_02940 [Alteromonas gracilis]